MTDSEATDEVDGAATEVEANKSARDYMREAVAELDPDGGGYQTHEATDLIMRNIRVHGIVDKWGRLAGAAGEFMRAGCSAMLRAYQPDKDERRNNRPSSRAANAAASGQHDFARDHAGFDWIYAYTALDESIGAVRKQLAFLTYAEVLQVIVLKFKKAAEARAMAERLQQTVKDYPSWAKTPKKTLAQILGAT